MTSEFRAALDALNLSDELRARLLALEPEGTPPSVDALVARLSLVRTFTETLYREAAAGLDSAPPLSAFATGAEVETLVGYDQRYAIAERTRQNHLSRWTNDRAGCAEWARRFARLLNRNDSVERLDLLQLQFLADEGEGRTQLVRAFEAADAADDVPQCAALVQLVAPIVRLFGDEASRVLVAELRSRSQSRQVFFTEFYQSNRYFPRPLDASVQAFVDSATGPWIFHLWAEGGMGKTTLLRRLVSHEWIVGSRHRPCAWIDMDYLDVATVLQSPALLGLVLAAQWNEQLAQPVFGAFLEPSLKAFASLLFRTRADGAATGLASAAAERSSTRQYRAGLSNPMRCGILAGVGPPGDEERQRILAQRTQLLSLWHSKLPEALASMPTDRPVVLVLDTLEEASLRHGQQLLDTLRLVKSARQRAHQIASTTGRAPINLKLILSGRYRLGVDHIPELLKEFDGELTAEPLGGFENPEARKFLAGEVRPVRPAADHDALLDAMVAKSGGIPFNLTLFAEWANDDPSLDAPTVRKSDDVNAVMLIERTVKRITYQPLRWIVRYGVVPRSLSVEFLRDVMRQPLLEALSGRAFESGSDRPTSAVEQDVWVKEDGFSFNAETLWREHVLPYTSERSWVTPGETDRSVVFRPDIVEPMRRLVGEQRVARQLHERARDWYAARMREAKDPAPRLSAAVEHVYHRTQLRSLVPDIEDDLLPSLRGLLEQPELVADPAGGIALCDKLREADFETLTVVEKAHVEYARALALAAFKDHSYGAPEAVEALKRAVDLVGADRLVALPPFARVWKQVIDLAATSEVIDLLRDLSTDDQARAAMLMTEAFGFASTDVRQFLQRAVVDARGRPGTAVPIGLLAERLAALLRDPEPADAARHLAYAADDYRARSDRKRLLAVLPALAASELALGRITRAEAALTSLGDERRRPFEIVLSLAEVELAKGNPGVALSLLAELDAAVVESSARALVVTGEALSQRMLADDANAAFDRATRVAQEKRDAQLLGRAAAGRARLYYWWMRTTAATTPPRVQSELAKAQQFVWDVAQQSAEARHNVDVDVWRMLYGGNETQRFLRVPGGTREYRSPAAQIRQTLALSQVVPPLPPRRWTDLVDAARRLPPGAELAALTEPVLLGNPVPLGPGLRQEVADAFRADPNGPIETAWQALRRAELLAWLQFHEEAAELLARDVPTLRLDYHGNGWVAATYRERRRVEQRIRTLAGDRSPLPTRPEPDPPDLWWRFWGRESFRAAAATVESAQRAFDGGHAEVARECLDAAQPVLREQRLRTEFHEAADRLADTLATRRHFPGTGTLGFEGHAPTLEITGSASNSGASEGLEAAADGAVSERATRLGGPFFSVIELMPQAGRLAVSCDQPLWSAVLSAECETLETLLRSRGIPRRLVEKSLGSIMEELTEALHETELAHAGDRAALRIPLSSLTCAPWETAFERAPFRLPSHWRESDVDVVGALDDLPWEEQRAVFRPLSRIESVAARRYDELESRFRHRLEESAGAGRPLSVLHVAANLAEGPSEPILAGCEWTAATLAHAATRGNPLKPGVILDVPMPVTTADLVHQLLLRNYFAQALIDTGDVAWVMASGLYFEPEVVELHGILAGAGPDVHQIDLLDAIDDLARRRNLPCYTALFTSNPYAPARGTRRQVRA